MAITREVAWVNKTNRHEPHERISHICGWNEDGTQWRLTVDRAITGIESGDWHFYVYVDGWTAYLVVATHDGHKYLKTNADGIDPDNLLRLPEFPGYFDRQAS